MQKIPRQGIRTYVSSLVMGGILLLVNTAHAAVSFTLQDSYDRDTDGSDAVIVTNTTDGAVVVAGDQNFVFSSSGDVIFDTDTLFVDSSTNRVGIGDTTPAAALTVGSGDLFQVTSAGAIAAATGILSTGIIDFTGARLAGSSPLVFEGGTVDTNRTTLAIADPTANNVITLKNGTGTLAFLSDLVTQLSGLSDVSLSSLSGGDLLVYNGGGTWVNHGMSGDATLSASGVLSISAGAIGATQLASTAVSPGTYGSSTLIPVITVDADGRVTAASTAAAAGGSSKFGGDGSDGALNISSGTTTVDLLGKRITVLNYSSISITGTGKLAFSNPHTEGSVVVIRVQGDATITSNAPAIDLRNMGGAAGNGATVACTGGFSVAAESGHGPTAGNGAGQTTNDCDKPGQPNGFTFPGSGGLQLYVDAWSTLYAPVVTPQDIQASRSTKIYPGGGGGGGAASRTNFNGGNGGRGAGSMFLEIGGTYTFTGSIDSSGGAGSSAEDQGGGNAGGGGGGGGHLLIMYETLGSDTGTYILNGGAGGSGTTASTGDGGGGGGGSGAVLNSGSNGTAASGPVGGGGGAGAIGTVVRMLNNVF